MARTYANMGAALADPNSNASKTMKRFDDARLRNAIEIEKMVQMGMTREEAWAMLLPRLVAA